ncbi:MAG: WD40 repeat domain-containing protein, partial [Promethearchaeota archaeon]
IFECPEAVLTCSILKCKEKNFLIFGGHDKTLYLMDEKLNIIDDREFDGWCRCSFTVDIDGDGCDEVLVGAGDGNFMVLKLNEEKKKLVGLMRYRSPKKITSCIAGDFTRNGKNELIFGGEDKTVKIFDGIKAKEPKFILYYDSWVTTSALGYLKLPNEKLPIYGLVVGTKSGIVQLIQFKDGVPNIVWNQNFNSQVNALKIGDVTNDGFNEIVLSTDDSTIKILTAGGVLLKEIESEEGRPLSLIIEDIDGDNAKEIIAGCSDGTLKVFHNPNVDSKEFELKWKTKVQTSIKDVCYLVGQDQKHIVFGGYDRTIRNVTDFEWGKKPQLNIPDQLRISDLDVELEEGIVEDLASMEEVPTNIREHIFKILTEKGYIKDIAKELTDLGYTQEEILNELDIMITQKSVIYEKIEYPVWTSPEEEKEGIVKVDPPAEEPKSALKHMVIEEPIKSGKEKLHAALSSEDTDVPSKGEVSVSDSLEDVIIGYLKEKKLVQTKAQFMDDIVNQGFVANQVEKMVNSLKDQGKIKYSRAKPKGWSLTE